MKITIVLTLAEELAIKAYLKDVEEIEAGIEAIASEVKTRFYHSIRDTRESISSYVEEEEAKLLHDYDHSK